MQPCKIGLSRQAPGGGFWQLRFCSERCLAVGSEGGATLPISVALPAQKSFQLSKHTLTLLFHAEKLTNTHLARNTLVKVSLLMDKFTKLFVLQQLRTADCQVVLGFSISEELSILEPLACYTGNDNADVSFGKIKQEGFISSIIQDALMQGFGFQTIQLLIEHHKAHDIEEQLPSELC